MKPSAKTKQNDRLKRLLQLLDQKNRELEIEAALEKVRSRSLAMHKSSEFQSVVNVIFDVIAELKIESESALLLVPRANSLDMDCWIQNSDGTYSTRMDFTYSENSLLDKDIFVAQKRQKASYVKTYTKEQKDKHFKRLFKTSLKDIPEKRKQYILNSKACSVSISFEAHIGIFLQRFTDQLFSDADNNVVMRLVKVVEQSYTRFLDIQKTEAQAREAEIQLALERVRARTMAMQKSEELPETAAVLFQQFKSLGQELMQMTIGIVHEEKGTTEFSVTDWGGSGEGVNQSFSLSNDEPTLISKMFAGWKEGKKSIIVDLVGKELESWLAYRNAMSGVTVVSSDSGGRRVISSAFFSKGHLSFSSLRPPFAENIELLERFAAVFDLTYTRFLDLKKAEEQAREAEIQLALERVRARIMAMHKSEELSDVIKVVSDQLQQLHFKFDNASFVINSASEDYDFWFSIPGQDQPYHIHVPYINNPINNRAKDARSKGVKFFADIVDPTESRAWHQHMFNHNQMDFLSAGAKAIVLQGGFARSVAIMPNIMLVIGNYTSKPYSEEENSIIRRFAVVFEQTYTRFLDLQKAEKQAREARIEAALEKVRSRSLAMHKAEELGEVAAVVFEKLRELDMPVTDGVAIVTHIEGSKDQIE